MEFLKASEVPEKTGKDALYSVIKGGLSLGSAGALGELFGILVQSPFERRLINWMRVVDMRLRHLTERDRALVDRLSISDEFTGLFLAATQAAVKTARREKLEMLGSAVEQSAANSDIAPDIQIMFVRFVDELTPSHFGLLGYLSRHAALVADVDSYPKLRSLAFPDTRIAPTEMEFKLLCNDLASRVLVRFSAGLEDFEGLSGDDVIVSGERKGAYIIVTHLGLSLLGFVGEGSGTELPNER
jgi:hypothetical protein